MYTANKTQIPYQFESTKNISHKLHLIILTIFYSADGNYEVRYKSNVLIYPTGEVLWVPPAIYQVSIQVVNNNIHSNALAYHRSYFFRALAQLMSLIFHSINKLAL